MAIKTLIQEYILLSLSGFFISVILTPIIRKNCQQRNVLDFPNLSRKIHTHPLPRLGGIAIYAGFFLPLFSILLTKGQLYTLFIERLDVLLSLFVTSSLIFAIGLYDDIRGATVLQKFFVQVFAAALIYFLGFKIDLLAMPFIGQISLGILGFPLTILWFVGVTNAINFTDGVDGVASGVGFFSVSTIFILSLFLHHSLTACFAAVLAGGIFGFALYNFAPASIFMGDSGSLFIGFVIAAISLHGSQKSSTAVVLLIPIVALGVPITDTLLAIVRRVGRGRSPFTADKEHIHHKLLSMGFSSRQVAFIFYGACCLLGITALLMTAVNNQVLTLILLILSVMTIGGMKMLGYTTNMIEMNAIAKKRIQQKKDHVRRQKFAQEILAEIQTVSESMVFKKLLLRYFESLEFDRVSLRITPTFTTSIKAKELFSSLNFTWTSPRYEEQHIPRNQLGKIQIPLVIQNIRIGELDVGKYLAPDEVFLETFLFVEQLKYTLEQLLAA